MNETATKLKQNIFKTVLKHFVNCFVSVSFQLCGQFKATLHFSPFYLKINLSLLC